MCLVSKQFGRQFGQQTVRSVWCVQNDPKIIFENELEDESALNLFIAGKTLVTVGKMLTGLFEGLVGAFVSLVLNWSF